MALPKSEYVKNASVPRNKGNGWLGQLFRNAEFVTQVNETYTNVVRPAADDLTNKIDEYAAGIESSAALNFQRYGSTSPIARTCRTSAGCPGSGTAQPRVRSERRYG